MSDPTPPPPSTRKAIAAYRQRDRSGGFDGARLRAIRIPSHCDQRLRAINVYASGTNPSGQRVSMTVLDTGPRAAYPDFFWVDFTASGSEPCGAPGIVSRARIGESFVIV